MTAPKNIVKRVKDRLLEDCTLDVLLSRLEPRDRATTPLPPHIPARHDYTNKGAETRRTFLQNQGIVTKALEVGLEGFDPETLKGNIENFIGFSRVPIGIIGPLRVNGAHVQGDFYVPLATSEGALIASYSRGALALSLSGGASSICTTESVARAPCFTFNSVREAGRFLEWTCSQFDRFPELIARRSRYAKLIDMKANLTGKDLYLVFEYTTGDASGQNMVTLATEEICSFLVNEAPIKPCNWYIEGNLSGDKKATMLSFMYTRGKKVIAEIELPASVISKVLHTDAAAMQRYWEISFIGGSQSGSIGSQGHYANALAALFIACGQDAACVSEAAVGVTRMQASPSGSLYVSVTLPNLIVGTVGGGTHLPTARACLEMLTCYGEGKAKGFSEICAATVLAGEISIIAALTSGDFAKAHAALGRKK